MLSLTRKTDYALVALAYLARNGNGKASARDLSEKLGVPVRVLTVILNRLTHCGMVASIRGTTGGYRLARPAREISLRDLIEALEGPVRLARCCSETDGSAAADDNCGREDSCDIRVPVRRLHGALRDFLGQVTLHDIVSEEGIVARGVSGCESGHGSSSCCSRPVSLDSPGLRTGMGGVLDAKNSFPTGTI